jgi:outer membrane protein insertion porin family
MMLFNAEYLFPIVKAAKIRGLVFFDSGNAFADGEAFDFSDLKSSVGWGIRWNSPFGPLRVEWGYALDAEDDEDTSQFEFSIGTGF